MRDPPGEVRGPWDEPSSLWGSIHLCLPSAGSQGPVGPGAGTRCRRCPCGRGLSSGAGDVVLAQGQTAASRVTPGGCGVAIVPGLVSQHRGCRCPILSPHQPCGGSGPVMSPSPAAQVPLCPLHRPQGCGGAIMSRTSPIVSLSLALELWRSCCVPLPSCRGPVMSPSPALWLHMSHHDPPRVPPCPSL